MGSFFLWKEGKWVSVFGGQESDQRRSRRIGILMDYRVTENKW